MDNGFVMLKSRGESRSSIFDWGSRYGFFDTDLILLIIVIFLCMIQIISSKFTLLSS